MLDMSVSTPILTTLPDRKGSICAEAELVSARTGATLSATAKFIGIPCRVAFHIADIVVRLVEVLSKLIADRADDTAMLDGPSRPHLTSGTGVVRRFCNTCGNR